MSSMIAVFFRVKLSAFFNQVDHSKLR